MSFDGTLISFSDGTVIPTKYIKADSYKVLYSINDLDSYRDANGVLHRNALDHRIAKVEWETPNMLTNTDVATLFGLFSDRYSTSGERKCKMKMYIPETDSYVTQDVYMSDPTMQIYSLDSANKVIKYDSFRIALIGY